MSAEPLWVNLSSPDPSTFMEYISLLTSRSETKAIFVPSGEQAGAQSDAGESVSFNWDEPSEDMEYKSRFPPLSDVNTIFSGPH